MFKNVILFLFLVIIFKTNLFAQTDTLWTSTYGGSGYEYGYSVEQAHDGGYIIAGYTSTFGAGSYDAYVVKTDADGDTVWTKTYGGSSLDEARCIYKTNDNGYIITGHTSSYGAGFSDAWLIKIGINGDTSWTKTYGGASVDEAHAVQQTSDNGYVFTGKTRPSMFPTSDQLYLVKTYENGDTMWTKNYGGSGLEIGWSVEQTDDQGYIIAGRTDSYGTGNYDMYIIKTDLNGDTSWTKTFGNMYMDNAYNAKQTHDGNYIIVGSIQNVENLDNLYLLKLDSNGDTLWTKTYGGNTYCFGTSIQQTPDNGFLITGGITVAEHPDLWIVKTDAEGDTLWTRIYDRNPYSEYGWKLEQISDEGIIITGITNSLANLTDIWLAYIEYPARISTIYPTQNDLNTTIDATISVTFDDDVIESTINDTTFLVFSNYTGKHNGVISYNTSTKTVFFNPNNDFHIGEVITVMLTKETLSDNGLYLDNSFSWSFTCAVDNGSAFFVLDSSYATGFATSTSVVADFNQDGNLDVAVTSHSSNQVSVFFNDGNAVFSLSNSYTAASPLQSLFAADLDNDGDVDILTAQRTVIGQIYILLNQGDGTFIVQPPFLSHSSDPGSIIASDIDGDDDLDIITGNAGSDNLSVFLNNGDATFIFDTNYSVGDAAGIYAADMENDGDQDIVGGLWANWDLFVMMNNNNGEFYPAEIYGTGETPGFVIPADLDGDGCLDLSNTNHYENTVHVYLNDGEGAFPSYSSYDIGSGAYIALPADLDGDGDLDLAIQNYADDNLSILVNNGSGIFADQELIEAADAPVYLAYGDFDNDGDLDLVAPNLFSNNFSIFLNTEPSDIEAKSNTLPATFNLSQNYPNPFNPVTRITYHVPQANQIEISIYNILGEKVRTLVNKNQQAGIFKVEWDASNFPSGVYFYRLETESGFVQTRKLVLLK